MPLVVSDVSVSFGTVLALHKVSLTVESGRMHALMGPSGSGKSTLLGVIAGEITPSSGCVVFDPNSENSVEWIFQTTPMLERRTAEDNVALGAIGRGASYDEAIAASESALTVLGLHLKRRVKAYQLSGGERQRTAVARAIVSGARVVLADEPTSSLDATARALVIGSLREAADRGAIVIVATHDRFVSDACDFVTILQPGGML